jgi:hypothetical protein
MKVKGAKAVLVEEVGRVVVEHRFVENPLTTDGLVNAAIEDGNTTARWMPAAVNLVTMIGGLARIKGLSPMQKAAAARYRTLYERAQIGGARATDYSAAKVDVSGGGRDVVMDGADARREYARARRELGPFRASLLEKVICEEVSVREVARSMMGGSGDEPKAQAGRRKTTRLVLEATDELVRHFGEGKRRVRVEGETPGAFEGVISTRRTRPPH